MNTLGAVTFLALVLFVALALAFRLAIRRAETTGIGSAEGFVTGAAIANTGMYAMRPSASRSGGRPDQEILPPLPTQSAK